MGRAWGGCSLLQRNCAVQEWAGGGVAAGAISWGRHAGSQVHDPGMWRTRWVPLLGLVMMRERSWLSCTVHFLLPLQAEQRLQMATSTCEPRSGPLWLRSRATASQQGLRRKRGGQLGRLGMRVQKGRRCMQQDSTAQCKGGVTAPAAVRHAGSARQALQLLARYAHSPALHLAAGSLAP